MKEKPRKKGEKEATTSSMNGEGEGEAILELLGEGVGKEKGTTCNSD